MKNYIRSFIDQNPLGSLPLPCIVSAEAKKTNFDQEVYHFGRLKCRNKALIVGMSKR